MNTIAGSVLRSLLIALAVLVIWVPTSSAQDSRRQQAGNEAINVAVLNLEGRGVDEKLLQTLTSVLRNEAQQYGSYDIVNQSPINLSEIVVVLGCSTNNPACLKQAAEQLEARVLIYGRVEKVQQAHKVTIEVFDAASGQFEQRLVRTLANNVDPVVAFRRQIQSMFSAEQAVATTRLQIGSSVDGAKVKLNGTMVGTAPIERTGLPPGTYRVEVYQDGYATWRASIDLTEGADIRLWAPLTETAGGEDSGDTVARGDTVTDGAGADSDGLSETTVDNSWGETHPPRSVDSGPNWGAWSAIGVGSAALGGSLAFAGLMGVAEDDLVAHDTGRNQMSRETYIADREAIVDRGESYELAHKVLLGVGAVSVVAGTAWLLFDDDAMEAPMAEAPTWDVAVSPRGVSAFVSW